MRRFLALGLHDMNGDVLLRLQDRRAGVGFRVAVELK